MGERKVCTARPVADARRARRAVRVVRRALHNKRAPPAACPEPIPGAPAEEAGRAQSVVW